MSSNRASVVKVSGVERSRNVKEVPFVELYGGRVQGVAKSGSDEERVYVCFVEAGTGNHSCNTNNNRPCSQNYFCKHREWVLEQAIEQYGALRVARYLGASGDLSPTMSAREIMNRFPNAQIFRGAAPNVFSRFLGYLRYVELEGTTEPLPDLAWFVTGG